ncbi:hypothetical protein FISHEDRAFT_62670 [Fistulina hepatica ATCC 64428]|nr:hypothetical protein FISHEDRAFT_62670 [Fistulina hepatica ATCC 64428]
MSRRIHQIGITYAYYYASPGPQAPSGLVRGPFPLASSLQFLANIRQIQKEAASLAACAAETCQLSTLPTEWSFPGGQPSLDVLFGIDSRPTRRLTPWTFVCKISPKVQIPNAQPSIVTVIQTIAVSDLDNCRRSARNGAQCLSTYLTYWGTDECGAMRLYFFNFRSSLA